MLEYNPVTKNGLFETTYKETTKRYRGVDKAEAKWKLMKALGLNYHKDFASITAKTIEATRRVNG